VLTGLVICLEQKALTEVRAKASESLRHKALLRKGDKKSIFSHFKYTVGKCILRTCTTDFLSITMERGLGLDVGANSIGWAVIEANGTDGRILGCGVYVFPEGVENLGQGEREISLNATRRSARQRRRQLYHRKLRKRALLKLMGDVGLCPSLSPEELRTWQNTGTFPERPEFLQWLKLNPYQLRRRATTEKVSLFELGRIFYHIAQRRGFPSKSRSAASDDRSVIEDGDPKSGKIGIAQTKKLLESNGHPTLGAALGALYPPDGKPFSNRYTRIRNRYTDRQMYIDEFEYFWSVQEPYYPDVLTEELKTALGGRRIDGYKRDGILFFQRPLRSQKHLVGRCSFEPSKPRCQKSHPLYERFRAYQTANNIRCNDLPLTAYERENIVRLLLTKKQITFAKIRKALKKTSAEFIFNYDDTDTFVGSPTTAVLSSKNIFGARWFELSDDEQHIIWHALQSFDNIEKLAEHARTHFQLSDNAAQAYAQVRLVDGYASLSLKAIRLITPFLEQGYPYHIAYALAGVRRAFGNDQWNALNPTEKKTLCDSVESIISTSTTGGYIEKLRSFLQERYGLSERALQKLAHHSSIASAAQLLERIPTDKNYTSTILSWRNPIVSNVMFALRRLVNELLERFGPFDQTVIELARDLKLSKKQRAAIRQEQKRNEYIRQNIKQLLENSGIEPTAENILRYRLWLECEKQCPYSGRTISFDQLYSGQVQIEHIIPYDRSLDDSYHNKTLCFSDINRKKGNRTPYEFFIQDYGPDHWNKVKEHLNKIFTPKRRWDNDDCLNYFPDRRRKYERFIAEKLPEGFATRQLNDTRIASRRAREMLELVCPSVHTALGPATAKLRRFWGLERVLSTNDNTADSKERSDHRHHALDAIVLACTRQSHIQLLSTASARQRNIKPIHLPWNSFRQDVIDALAGCIVVHHRSDRVLTRRRVHVTIGTTTRTYRSIVACGQLHKETYYGLHTDPDTGKQFYHVRVPLQELKKRKDVEEIVDPTIRKLVQQRIEELGGYRNDAVPNTFFETTPEGSPKPTIFLPNRRGDMVPVYKVRTRRTISNAIPHRKGTNRYVDPSNNHHAIIYRLPNGALELNVVQFWEAVQRKLRGEPLYQVPPNCELVMTLHINDMVLLGCTDELLERIWQNYPPQERGREIIPYLHKVQKLSYSKNSGFELCFRHHTDARPSEEAKHDYVLIRNWGTGKLGWYTYNPIKLRITPSGLCFRWDESSATS